MYHKLIPALMIGLALSSFSVEAAEKKKRSLSDMCMVLTSYDTSTYIPKGAVLYTPKRLENKIVPKLKGNFVSWKTFLAKNSGWIHLHQVSRYQAAGRAHIKPAVIKAYKTMGKMVIAQNYGNIIAVKKKALKPPSK